MERIQSINTNRIRWCCKDRDLAEQDLAGEVGIAPATLEKLMAGESGITFNQLRKIADYFNRGVLFFLNPDPINEDFVHTPQFRTLANQKPELTPKLKSLIERVEKQRDIYLSLRDDLGLAGEPLFVPPRLPDKNPERAAEIVRKWLGLDSENTFDGYRSAVEKRGVLVFRSNGYHGPWQIEKQSPVCGFSLFDASCPVIVVKKQAPMYDSRQVFTLMHELGHCLLHKRSFIDEEEDLWSYQGMEREANAFAGALLVPAVFLDEIGDRTRPDHVNDFDNWLLPYRKAWGVSTEVILRRLFDSDRLSRDDYEAYRRLLRPSQAEGDSGTRMYRHREPKHIFGDTFVRTVLEALNESKITLSKASTYLDNLKIDDVHRLERHYAGL